VNGGSQLFFAFPFCEDVDVAPGIGTGGAGDLGGIAMFPLGRPRGAG
jgi:hypothetical protein